MTDDKGGRMQSDGPYRMVGGMFEGPNGFSFRIVWGPDFKLDDKIIAEEVIKIANQAHCEGRKAERERCAGITRKHFSCEGIAQEIEKEIMGEQDAE